MATSSFVYFPLMLRYRWSSIFSHWSGGHFQTTEVKNRVRSVQIDKGLEGILSAAFALHRYWLWHTEAMMVPTELANPVCSENARPWSESWSGLIAYIVFVNNRQTVLGGHNGLRWFREKLNLSNCGPNLSSAVSELTAVTRA